MLNEEKILLMTKLALYEQKKGRKAIKVSKYFKNDYVTVNTINTVLTITLAYFLLLVLWIIYKVDYFTDEIVYIDLFNLGKKILIIYLIVLAVFTFLAYVVYSIRYIKMKSENEVYAQSLKELYLIYKREEKNKKEAKLGGNFSDDETFGL